MDRIGTARDAKNYDQLLIILQQMDSDELRAVDDGSLPTWGDRPTEIDCTGSLLSWDTELDTREVRIVYSDDVARLSFRDDTATID